MSAVAGLKHYWRAITTGIADGSLRNKVNRYVGNWRVERAIVARYGLEVRKGPFRGMHYIQIPPYRALPGKLLGFYEEELYPALNEILKTPYDTVINIGSAEGYYAVGCAVKLPKAQVYAFDIDERQQGFCARLARLNGVENRVHIRGEGTSAELQSLATGKTLIIMDCEGCEDDLLQPERTPNLRRADILLELHDFEGKHLTEAIRARFASSHSISEVGFHGRNADDYPELQFLKSASDRKRAALDRDVETQTWFFMRAQ